MNERQKLLESIVATTADYRARDLAAPTPEHVDRWATQFSAETQLPILREMNHVLKNTYFSLEKVIHFLKTVLNAEKLVGADPCGFGRSVAFLDIQSGGNSQREMLALFGQILQQACGIKIEDCGSEQPPSEFIYLDDAIFTGNRVRRDLETWIKTNAPSAAKVHVISIALHTGGRYYANAWIQAAAKAAGKTIKIIWWHSVKLEDRLNNTNTSDVLRPASIPDVPDVTLYLSAMTHQTRLRVPGSLGAKSLFSSEEGRNVLEQEFLKAGVEIRGMCANLGDTQRPLGHSTLETLGFGSLIVTFRNCPNNAPLALWVGEPWYPLFPRTTNSQTAIKRLFEHLTKGES